MKLSKLPMFLLVCMVLMCFLYQPCILAQMYVEPATDFQISWDGGGTWIDVPMSAVVFDQQTLSAHKPFAAFGLNAFEADVSDVWLADPNTRIGWQGVVQDPNPGDTSGTIWKTGWFHHRVRVAVGSENDVTDWSDMQVFHVKTPKKPKTGRLVRI